MKERLLQLLCCPSCKSELRVQAETTIGNEIETGLLVCEGCEKAYRVERGIPRFVPTDNYASSFGLQWNRFRRDQLDIYAGISQSERRFYTETGIEPETLGGKWILDAGCGAGRFLEVASRGDCDVVGIDISTAVDAARENLRDRDNVHLVQANLFELPFRDEAFDICYSIGVIQHTPDPLRAVQSLPRVLKPGGSFTVTIYERRKFTRFYSKYLVRRITTRLPPPVLLKLIQLSMPLLFPVTELLFRVPVLGRLFRFAIPVANYVDDPELSLTQRYRWAILDTFDMLSPRYDLPQTEAPVREALLRAGVVDVERRSTAGLCLVGRRSGTSTPRAALK